MGKHTRNKNSNSMNNVDPIGNERVERVFMTEKQSQTNPAPKFINNRFGPG